MDRIEFIHSISYTEEAETVNLLMSYFNQYMLLYNLIDDILKITYESSYANSIEFLVDYKSQESAKKNISEIMAHNPVNIYNKICHINIIPLSDSSIRIQLFTAM